MGRGVKSGHRAAALAALAVIAVACAPAPVPVTVPAASALDAAHPEWPVIPFADPAYLQARYASFEYAPGLRADLYWPPGFAFDRDLPAAFFMVGLAASSFESNIGARATETGLYRTLCSGAAARGMVAIVFDADVPMRDIDALLSWLRTNRRLLRLDLGRIALWARSEHAAFALLRAALPPLRRAVRGVSLVTPVLPANASVPAPGVPVKILEAGGELPARTARLEAYLPGLARNGNPVVRARYEDGMHAFEMHELDEPGAVRAVEGSLDFLAAVLEGR